MKSKRIIFRYDESAAQEKEWVEALRPAMREVLWLVVVNHRPGALRCTFNAKFFGGTLRVKWTYGLDNVPIIKRIQDLGFQQVQERMERALARIQPEPATAQAQLDQ